MVRSKFPGKPSKIVNRKVVKSCKYSVLHDNESSKAAQNISYGLAVFNETFGDHEQVRLLCDMCCFSCGKVVDFYFRFCDVIVSG